MAARNLNHVGSTIAGMREHIAECVTAPVLAEHRTLVPQASDEAVLEAAASLRHTQHWVRGRAAFISSGLIMAGKDGELETSAPTVGLGFEVFETKQAW